ncbi:hypothetical protein [Pseudochrobactrum asaccharolyticum]|uniref:hypothetical protein n=1 Tax=Pseudochrobactrum asaccharolyticum TaxID=354351 RepID=UPI001F285B4A|nr:hypothetical protein [Pseudochrobactrum asaccharolyticum]MCF7643959.1 hypothetical protein [Pseudochrobactrum asaccharolyticum]
MADTSHFNPQLTPSILPAVLPFLKAQDSTISSGPVPSPPNFPSRILGVVISECLNPKAAGVSENDDLRASERSVQIVREYRSTENYHLQPCQTILDQTQMEPHNRRLSGYHD